MSDQLKIDSDRKRLVDAQEKGFGPTLGVYIKLSGPGWLQSAITLGGGSLAGALFLGALAGNSLLWLQLVAITMGVIMLSAISYVTLSTGERPFRAINQHINPVLGWGWLIATCTANMIWCMPQFSLCFTALEKNLVGPTVGGTLANKLSISLNIFLAALFVVLLSSRGGRAAKFFDYFLKALVGTIVLCFFGVVVYLGANNHLDWNSIFRGFVPDLRQWSQPTGEVANLVSQLPTEELKTFWSDLVVRSQRDVMVGAAATAVGINMTFLMPYAMLNRGWNKPFRGLARFDLCTGMAIPYILVTSCVVIAAAQSFHGKADEKFLSSDPHVMRESPIFGGASDSLVARVEQQMGETAAPQTTDFDALTPQQKRDALVGLATLSKDEAHKKLELTKLDTLDDDQRTAALAAMASRFDNLSDDDKKAAVEDYNKLSAMAGLSAEEKRIAGSVVKRNAFQLSQALAPLFGETHGEKIANVIFGIGIFGMGFSTIIILMLINGFAFSEMLGKPQGGTPHIIGCIVAGVAGSSWPFFWSGDSKVWLAILVSSFGMMLLPIAYFTFFMMMNSKKLMGKEKPTGVRMVVWNVLMGISVLGAIVAAGSAIFKESVKPVTGLVVISIGITYVVLVVIGFIFKFTAARSAEAAGEPAADAKDDS